jgi:hypothetical protein
VVQEDGHARNEQSGLNFLVGCSCPTPASISRLTQPLLVLSSCFVNISSGSDVTGGPFYTDNASYSCKQEWPMTSHQRASGRSLSRLSYYPRWFYPCILNCITPKIRPKIPGI